VDRGSLVGAGHPLVDARNQTDRDIEFVQRIERYFGSSLGTNVDKLRNFPKFVPRQALSLFLAKHELFRAALNVHGYIIECGVFLGGGVMMWAQLSAIFEPVNHVHRLVGFDTFSGISQADQGKSVSYARPGGLAVDAEEDLRECIGLYDLNRPVGHKPRVQLVRGDATRTIPEYVAREDHLVVAMLYLDFDLYEPSRAALEHFVPRMPKGAILTFDELNQPAWPGETRAVLDTLGPRSLRIQRFPYVPQLSYAVLE